MPLFISSIASGSNGNCYYIGTPTEAVLVDVGISCREVERRMQRLGLSIGNIKAVFISHEHSDHICGLPILANKYSLPVYITKPTQQSGRLHLHGQQVYAFRHGEAVTIGSLRITPFSKAHDAADPYSFVVSCDDINVGVFTDIGKPCPHLRQHFATCHAAFLEANYDEQLLACGSYPAHLKARIRGGNGHLSNTQALQLFLSHRSPQLSHLLLAHLSKNNNCPDLVANLFAAHAGATNVVVASRYEETAVYKIEGQPIATPAYVAHYNAPVSQLEFLF